MPEIPIWVNDKKKWVTGISKKTTINDIIYAILKQCAINCDYESINDYALIERTCGADQLLKGTAKVYKHLPKWSEHLAAQSLLLKVKKCEYVPVTSGGSGCDDASSYFSADLANQRHLINHLDSTQQHKEMSLSRLFKKFTVNNNNNSNSNGASLPSKLNAADSNALNSPSVKYSLRYVDVKLPNVSSTSNVSSSLSSTAVPSSNHYFQFAAPKSPQQTTAAVVGRRVEPQLPYKQYDPSAQKSMILGNIMDRDMKIKQQFERVKILDELIKESEKTLAHNESYYLSTVNCPDSSFNINNSNSNNNNLSLSSTSSSTGHSSSSPPQVNHGLHRGGVELHDVYSSFPEMQTHNLSEVKEFTEVCAKLLQLDETLAKQRNLLGRLEGDIQRELVGQQASFCGDGFDVGARVLMQQQQAVCSVASTDTPETLMLKREVSASREQTRLQCKELHDLDVKMRHNETLLGSRENTLRSLLEELYLNENCDAFNEFVASNGFAASELKICDGLDVAKVPNCLAVTTKLKTLAGAARCEPALCADNDSGISSMSSENNDRNFSLASGHQQIQQQQIQQQQIQAKKVMETLV